MLQNMGLGGENVNIAKSFRVIIQHDPCNECDFNFDAGNEKFSSSVALPTERGSF